MGNTLAWECSKCTYKNEANNKKCSVCRAERPQPSLEEMFAIQSRTVWECHKCNASNSGHRVKCSKCRTVRMWSLEPENAATATCKTNKDSGGSPTTDVLPCPGATFSVEKTENVPESEVRIVLLGRTGEGKSSTGNTIIGKDEFVQTSSPSSVTKECQRGRCTRFGRCIQVIDTPGMFDTEMSTADITREVVRCVGMTAPGPHVFLLVLTPGRFTDEVQNTVDYFMNIFGERFLNYLVLLFTRKDDLKFNGATIEEYLERESSKLKALRKSCSNRYVAFNNRGTPTEREEDVKCLLGIIDEMIEENKGVFSNEMLEEAEKIIKEKEEQLKKNHEEELKRQVEVIREDCNKQLKIVEENYEDIISQMQKRLQKLEQDAAKGSSGDVTGIRKLLRDMKTQFSDELRKIRDIAEGSMKAVKNQVVDYREKARKEVEDNSSFLKDILFPALFQLAKIALPIILQKVLKSK